MSRQESSSFVGTLFDSLEFARDGGELVGDLPLAGLERLTKGLGEVRGSLHFSLAGEVAVSVDGRATSWLHLCVAGKLPMECQRCLRPMEVPVAIDTRLQLIAPGAAWPDDIEDGATDAIPAEAAQSLKDLVEDEVLLALPIVPRHESCELPTGSGNKQPASPFAVLAQLKKQR